MHRKTWIVSITVVGMLAMITAASFLYLARGRTDPVMPHETNASGQQVAGFPAVSCDVAGVIVPPLVSADESGLLDDEIVIGVSAFGESRAFLQSAFDQATDRHVVNDVMGLVPVTITHCDRTRCTRVFTSGDPKETMNIRCGGWLEIQEMSLLVGDQEFAQSSSEIPLTDVPFVVSTWKEWRESHPDSMVYMGSVSRREKVLQK